MCKTKTVDGKGERIGARPAAWDQQMSRRIRILRTGQTGVTILKGEESAFFVMGARASLVILQRGVCAPVC